MTNTAQSAEPNREVVECAIVEVLRIAQRQGITPADFVRMLDAGMRVSDLLTAIDTFTDSDRTTDCGFSLVRSFRDHHSDQYGAVPWDTWGITKRKFRIVKRENNVPVLGVCECCNAEFAADPETIGRPKDAHAHIQKQFIAHKCKRLDASQNAVGIVGGGARSH